MGRILFVFTSANKTLTGAQTGWYLPEAAHPYYGESHRPDSLPPIELKYVLAVLAPHHTIDFASPKGPNPPVDEDSVRMFKDDESVRFLQDETVKKQLASAKKLSEVNSAEYDAVFYVGGHGPVLDLATDPVNIKLASEFWRAGKVTSAVCHGPAALVGVTDRQGAPIFSGRKATCFSDTEEVQVNKVKDIPFLVEDRIKQLGGAYEKAAEPWGVHVVVDGKLITGQNPASAKGVGEAIQKALTA
ncbi:ThiJ/PfpI [Laetiporus sulphureus 93-53]|uniref:D-lactate dehydratase n=1 Tax=Laetiporus sulphureus 93-53 TaxID=1314785 RepID=A0A165IHD5_9APHY|nr:ThiJ/PfpI [Laetiporus sulphureus 93-53]KZT13074.1 ThiJ/PfpI [Laetiporus sulphureus 93-53]